MNVRIRKAWRLQQVQAALDRLTASDLADLERKGEVLRERREELLRFLDKESAFSAVFSATLMRQLQSCAEREAQLAAETTAKAEQYREQHSRLRHATAILDRLNAEKRRDDGLRELVETIEGWQARHNFSRRQV